MDYPPPPKTKKAKKPANPHIKSLRRGDPEDVLPGIAGGQKPASEPVQEPPAGRKGAKAADEPEDKTALGKISFIIIK